ncbi:MAG: VOC family protein [Ectothiorhodospiraceae bacterium]|nr:VOC family protein [Ectothiorhodospiraceae bacterium]
MRPRFHLAFPVNDLEAARRFYQDVLGCTPGRTSERWIDFDFRGHQITAHLVDRHVSEPTNPVDGKQVPVRHFGLILPWDEWEDLVERLRAAGTRFLIEPGIRFQGAVGEQATCFLTDPSGNALEFKAFRDDSAVFETARAEG